MGLKIQVLSSVAACEAIRTEWDELLRSIPQATVFDTFGWIKANLLAFPNPDTWVLAFHDADATLLAVIPLVVRRGRRYLRTRRWVEFAGLPYADYGSCLVRSGWEAPVAESLVQFCCSKAANWDGVCLERLRIDDPCLGFIAAAAKNHGLIAVVRESDRIRLLTKQEFDGEAEGRHSSKSLRKSRNRLLEQGEIGFEVYDRSEPILARLDTFIAWHMERFAAKGVQSPLADAKHGAFYRHIVEELAPQGQIWLSALTCAERAIAMRFSLLFSRRLHLYSTCFDEAFAKYSPSMLQLEMLLQCAFKSGVECVDFGIGESPQKEFAGAATGQTLAALEIYGDKLSSLEGRLYQVAGRARSRSQLVLKGGKLFRRFFPYNVR